MAISRFIVMLFACLITATAYAQPLPGLLAAIRDNDSEKVKSLLSKKTELTQTDADSNTALMYAALYSTPSVMKQLLMAGADPGVKNKLGETALMWACPDADKAALLLQYKAGVNDTTDKGNNALLIACVGNNQSKIISLLLEHGANARSYNRKGWTGLIRLAAYGDTASANLLLQHGADVNIKNKDSMSALFIATKCNNAPMVKWLLDHGADPNTRDLYLTTPLYWAVLFDSPGIFNLLLERTTDVNRPDLDGVTPVMWAVYNEHDNSAVVQALIDRGADLSVKTKEGETVLDWALKKGNTKTVALLKKYNAKKADELVNTINTAR